MIDPRFDSHLQHYASKYYDPVKAHEYYMRHRHLKGRRPVSKLNDEGKKIWSVAKSNITSEKKEASESQRQTYKNQVEQLRQRAKETRQRISNRLKELNELLTDRSKSDRKRVSEKSKSDKKSIDDRKNAAIKRLQSQKIPKGLPAEERARKLAERKKEIEKLRSSAQSDKQKISDEAKNSNTAINENTKAERQSNSNSASAERKRVSDQLKSAVSAAREAYNKAKTNLNDSYENIFQKEYDNILSEYGKKK